MVAEIPYFRAIIVSGGESLRKKTIINLRLCDRSNNMQLQRSIFIIGITIGISGTLSLIVDGRLLVWIGAAWILSGPLVLVDAYIGLYKKSTRLQKFVPTNPVRSGYFSRHRLR